MTPFQHSRMGHKQRMLAGLGTLGFVNPPTTGLNKNMALLPSAQGFDTKTNGVTTNFTPLMKANTLAPPSTMKNLVGGTLQQPNVGSGISAPIDLRNAAATKQLTPSFDKLNTKSNSLFNPAPPALNLPGSNITPSNPGIINTPKTGFVPITPLQPPSFGNKPLTLTPPSSGGLTADKAREAMMNSRDQGIIDAAKDMKTAATGSSATGAGLPSLPSAPPPSRQDFVPDYTTGEGTTTSTPGRLAPDSFITTGVAPSSSKLPYIIGGVALVAVVGYLVFR